MTTLTCDTTHAARFFPTGSTVDLVDNAGKVFATHGVLLAVWRSDGTTVCYVDAPCTGDVAA